MVLCNSPYISQENMSELFVGLDTVCFYIDELLYITENSWAEHLTVLEEMLARLHKAGLKVNAGNSYFVAHKSEYLGYHVTCDGLMPITNKFEAIQAFAVPKTRKTLSQFIGMINFYRDMWQNRSELLSQLTALTSNNFKYKWKYKHQSFLMQSNV